LKGQIVSIDAVISLSLLAAMLVVWAQMYQDASPIFQIYTYRQTYLASDHIINQFLFSPSVPWRCTTPEGVPVPGCVKGGSAISTSTLGADDLNMNVYIRCTSFGTLVGSAPPSRPTAPLIARTVRACVGNWNACNVVDCNVEVWHR